MHTQFNKDVSDYKSNFWKGLTLRQTVFGALSMLSFVLFKVILDIWFEGFLLDVFGFGLAFIFAFLGFFNKDRLSAEEFSLIWIRYAKTPKVLNCSNKPIDIIPATPMIPEEPEEVENTETVTKEDE